MADAPPLLDVLDDARNVLVSADSLTATKDAACGSLLARAPPEETTLLAVTCDRSGTEWLEHARSALGGDAETARVVDASGTTNGEQPSAVTTAQPDDLTGIQIGLSEVMPVDGTAVFCLDSLTTMLQYIDPTTLFQFVNELLGRLWNAGVNAHMHLDVNAHDQSTVRSISSLFDAVVVPATDEVAVPTTAATVSDTEVAVARRPPTGVEGND